MQSATITRALAPLGYTLELKGSRVRVQELEPGVFDIGYVGLGHGAFAPEIHRDINMRVREGIKVTVCVDASEMAGYESAFRRAWTQWFSENKGSYYQVPILFKSALVSMGISLVNPLIGNMIIPLSDKAAYDANLKQALARARSCAPRARIA